MVLDRICRQLLPQDLKRLRLVCKLMDFFAQRALFRVVWVRANIDSFHKLDLISRNQILRHHIRVIHHSGEMINDYPDFDAWNKRLGGEIDVSWESRDVLRGRYTLEDLNYYYLKYRHHHEGQTYITTDNKAELLLVQAFSRIPRINTIEFASREVAPDDSIEGHIPFSAIGRETLSEPCSFGGFRHNAKQFIALLEAANHCCPNLTTVKGARLDWDIFETPAQLRTMVGAVKNIEHLVLTMSDEPDTNFYRKKLSQLLAGAPHLKTLELCFGTVQLEERRNVIDLKHILKIRDYWRTLHRLVLQGFSTTEKFFKKFLKTHAASLKSLELGNMSFPSLGEKPNGSFLSLIKFLQSSMKLEHMEFNGTFCNHWDEGWVVNWKNKFTNDEECLKSGIERFIVHGGRCPLKAPDKKLDDDDWRHRGDDSWRYEGGLLI